MDLWFERRLRRKGRMYQRFPASWSSLECQISSGRSLARFLPKSKRQKLYHRHWLFWNKMKHLEFKRDSFCNVLYFWQSGIHWFDTGSSLANDIKIPAAGRPVDVSRTCDEIGSGCLAMIFYIVLNLDVASVIILSELPTCSGWNKISNLHEIIFFL